MNIELRDRVQGHGYSLEVTVTDGYVVIDRGEERQSVFERAIWQDLVKKVHELMVKHTECVDATTDHPTEIMASGQ